MDASDIIDILSSVSAVEVAEAIKKLEDRKTRAIAEFNDEIAKLKRLMRVVGGSRAVDKKDATQREGQRPTDLIENALRVMESASVDEIVAHTKLTKRAVAVCLSFGERAGTFKSLGDNVWTLAK